MTGFDNALAAGEDEFVKRRIYLTLERGRDIALRNLLRKVFIAGGFEEPNEKSPVPVRRTRVTVAEFGAAISIGNKEKLDDDEVECLLANIIYKVSFPNKGCARCRSHLKHLPVDFLTQAHNLPSFTFPQKHDY